MECAVWYFVYGSISWEPCDDEAEAAAFAVSLEENGDGSVKGVQRADGSFTLRDDWAAYDVEDKRQTELAWQWVQEQASRPKPATRKIDPPFDANGQKVTVLADAPTWLGRQVASR